jgi:signal transduction histidine kinase/ActR/RegA family two-component response regulator/HAMP domain-containing protein
MLRHLSIQRKQMLIIMLTSTVVLLLAGAAFLAYEVVSFRQNLLGNLTSLAAIIGDKSTAALTIKNPKLAQDVLNALSMEPHVMRAILFDNAKRPVAAYFRDPQDRILPRLQSAADGHEFSRHALEVIRRVSWEGHCLGAVYVQSDLGQLQERFRQYAVIMSLVLGAALLVGLALSYRLQRVISDPILKLAALARQVSVDKNYSVRAARRSHDEVGLLTDGFNEMLEQIQARDVALQYARDELEKRVQERTCELRQEVADRRRAEEAVQQQLVRTRLLNSITRAIAARQDLESIVHTLLWQLEERLPIALGRVYLYDPQNYTISSATPRQPDEKGDTDTTLLTASIHIAQAGLHPCLRGELVHIPDTASGTFLLHQRLAAAQLRSAVAVPLMVETELFGVLVAARRDPAAFSAEDCEFLKVLSEQVALAAHQARLHTALQRAYDELRQTQSAVMQTERLRALGQMASGIVHDINNALCPIVVYADLLLQTETALSAAALKHLKNIKTAGEDIAHIVARMREFYRKRDKVDLLGPVNLNRLLQQVIELTRPRWRDMPQARGAVVTVETDLDPDPPPVTGNETEIREAITNLLMNAVDAMPNGGTLTLRTRRREWEHAAEGQPRPTHLVVEVSDTGTGMDEETRRRCLEPFFSTKGTLGTGLGLAMVYGIMERHEGSIEIESALGQGTTVRLVFPIRSAVGEQRLADGPVEPLPPLRVLCIDDEPLLREMLKQILQHGGHRVETADSGKAGLEKFRDARQRGEPFDVVITDLGMPHLDGHQLARLLKRESPATPVLMLTGWGSMLQADGSHPSHVDGLVNKPPRLTELYQALARVTRHSRKPDEAAA